MAIPFLLLGEDLVAVCAFRFEGDLLLFPALNEALARRVEEEITHSVVSFHPGTVFWAFVVAFEVRETTVGLAPVRLHRFTPRDRRTTT